MKKLKKKYKQMISMCLIVVSALVGMTPLENSNRRFIPNSILIRNTYTTSPRTDEKYSDDLTITEGISYIIDSDPGKDSKEIELTDRISNLELDTRVVLVITVFWFFQNIKNAKNVKKRTRKRRK